MTVLSIVDDLTVWHVSLRRQKYIPRHRDFQEHLKIAQMPALLTFGLNLSQPWKLIRPVSRTCSRTPPSNIPRASSNVPDAGLTAKAGDTGTYCGSLWPIPLLGGYNWLLNVYDRDLASSVGAFVVNHGSQRDITLAFDSEQKPSQTGTSKSHISFSGIATGNINVLSALRKVGYKGANYQLRLFEKGGAEPFFKRQNEVHVVDSMARRDSSEVIDPWQDPAPTYAVTGNYPSFELRDLYAGGGAKPRAPSSFEYFAMNLFPIFPFTKYSCFVSVWRRKPDTSPVAIDKRSKKIRMSFFDPIKLPLDFQDRPAKLACFAVRSFRGAIKDDVVYKEHKSLLETINSTGSMKPVSEKDFRIVVYNDVATLSRNLQNELWVQID